MPEDDETASDEEASDDMDEDTTDETTDTQDTSTETQTTGQTRKPIGLLAAALLIGAGIGFVAASMTGGQQPTAISGTDQDVRQSVQSLIDQQLQQQRQQFTTIANQSENISEADLSIDAEITSITASQFPSLRSVNVTYTGTVPRQLGDGTRQLDQTQTFLVTQDGQYLFQQPTNIQEQIQAPAQQ